MPSGIAIGRSWVVRMKDGVLAVDWGDGLFQDAISGEFLRATDSQVSHRALNSDLDWLCQIGAVESYDEHQAFFYNLPQRPIKTLE